MCAYTRMLNKCLVILFRSDIEEKIVKLIL